RPAPRLNLRNTDRLRPRRKVYSLEHGSIVSESIVDISGRLCASPVPPQGEDGRETTVMDCNIYCLVDASGHVYVKDGAVSHAEVAENFGLDAHVCDSYRFDLAARRSLMDHGKPETDRAA